MMVKIKQLDTNNQPFGKIIVTSGGDNFIFYDVSGLTYNIQKDINFPIDANQGDLFYKLDNNKLYHYDDSRTKWLTVSQENLICGRTSAVAGGTIYMRIGDATQSSTSGFKMINDGTIISASVINNDILTSPRNIDIRINNSKDDRVIMTIDSGQSGYSVDTLNLDFNKNDLIQVVATPGNDGSDLNNVIVVVTISYK